MTSDVLLDLEFFVQLGLLTATLGGAVAGFYRCWAGKQSEINEWRKSIEKLVDDNTHRNDLEGQDIARLKARISDHDDAMRRKDEQITALVGQVSELAGEVRSIARRVNGAPKHH